MKFGIAFCLPLLLAHALASEDSKMDAADLIKQACAKTDIRSLSSFRLRANVRVDGLGNTPDGAYSFLWNGADQWREEIAFPGFNQVRIGGKGIVFLARSTTYVPYAIFRLQSAMHLGCQGVAPRSDEHVKKAHEEKLGDSKAECVEIISEQKHTREVCVDEVTGIVNRRKWGVLATDFVPIGTKIFPRSISVVEEGRQIVNVHVTDLSTGEPAPDASFEPPRGADLKAGCIEPIPPHLTHSVEPHYPAEERAARREGRVVVYQVVDSHGIPQNLQVILGATPGLNQAAIDAMRQWRYQPATCNGIPVEVEATIETKFHLY